MDRGLPSSVRNDRVNSLIRKLGLTKAQHTRIGSHGMNKSISGGERKRLAFASEVGIPVFNFSEVLSEIVLNSASWTKPTDTQE